MFKAMGKWMVRLLWLIWMLVMLLLGIKIALDNTESVQLQLFYWQAPEVSLGLTVCLALLVGVIIGWIASTGPYLLARQRARRLQKRLAQSEQEVSNLRTAPLKG